MFQVENLKSLPIAGRLRHCFSNWSQITNNSWLLEVTKGYRLELDAQPFQDRPPLPHSQTDSQAEQEIAKFIQKKAIYAVQPCAGQPALHYSQEEWFTEASSEPEATEPHCGEEEVQNGRCSDVARPAEAGRLDDIHRPQGRLSVCPDPQVSQEIPPLQLEEQHLRIPVPTVRPHQCTPNIHEVDETGHGSPQEAGDQMHHLCRRHASHVLITVGAGRHNGANQYTPGTLGVHSQSGEVGGGALPKDDVPRLSVSMTLALPEEKLSKIVQDCSRVLAREKLTVRCLARLIGRMSAATQAIMPAPLFYRGLQGLKNAAFKSSQSYDTEITLSPEARQDAMWWTNEVRKWNGKSILTPAPDLTIESDASLLGWGASADTTATGGLWSTMERSLHINVLELKAGAFAIKTFVRNNSNVHVRLKMDNTTAVAYLNRMGGMRSPDLSHCAKQLWLWCLDKGITLSAEYLPGEMNTTADLQSRMLTSSAEWMLDPAVSETEVGTLRCGPLCNTPQPSARSVCVLEARPVCHRNRCAPDDLVQYSGVRVSPVLLDRKVPSQAEGRPSDHPLDCSNLATPVMVPQPARSTGPDAHPSPDIEGPSQGPIRADTPPHVNSVSTAGRMQGVRDRLTATGISQQASTLITAGWSKGTNSAYQSAWSKWHDWCIQRHLDPFSTSVSSFANFLASLYANGLQYRTINTVRSAVSVTHGHVEGIPLGQHPVVSRLMKGTVHAKKKFPLRLRRTSVVRFNGYRFHTV